MAVSNLPSPFQNSGKQRRLNKLITSPADRLRPYLLLKGRMA